MNKNKIYEDAVIAGGGAPAAGGEIASPSTGSNDIVSGNGIKTNDILGKYEKGEGVMGKGDFHCPDKLIKVKSRAIDGGKWKRKKDKPQVKIVHISEKELDDAAISTIHNLDEEDITLFLNDTYSSLNDSKIEILQIAYVNSYNYFMIKFKHNGSAKIAIADFKGNNFSKNSEYPDILTINDVKNDKKITTDSDIQIVWG